MWRPGVDRLLTDSLISGMQNALWFCAALAAIGIVLALFVRKPKPGANQSADAGAT